MSATQVDQALAIAAGGHSAPLEPHAIGQRNASSISEGQISEGDRPRGVERETGIEPATLSLGIDEGAVAGLTSGLQVAANPRLEPGASIQPVSLEASFSKNFASPLLPDFSASLTVKDVAACLRVCTATVYRLCAAGQLRHLRVGAAIRIREEDLAAYQAR